MIWRIWIIALVLIFPNIILADTSTFVVSVQGGEDNIPPTEPVMLSATPTAVTQIDVAWTASTDDVYLEGYVLLRDAVAIATTTLTSYSDTGLTASTTYSYSVYAFDAFGNISTTSAPLATTTLPLPVVEAATTSTTTRVESTAVLGLKNFSLETTESKANLVWQTTRPSRYSLKWGRTEAFESGYIESEVYRQNQTTTITDLEPGTTYLYELIAYDARGFSVELRSGSFTTKSLAALVPPNVKNLRATLLSDGAVDIRYDLPLGYEKAKVRIVRSYLGYPRDIFDGAVLFEGNSEQFLDKKAFLQGEREYYAIFLLGEDGTYSSGALAVVNKYINPGTNPITEDGITLPIEIEEIPLLEFDFDRRFIEIIQGENKATFASTTVQLRLDANTVIRIPYSAVPDTLKSIVVTITDPSNTNRTYSFLLRINKDRTAYEAVLAPLGVAGDSRIVVEIFDFERRVVGRYQKAVVFVQGEKKPAVIFPDQIVESLRLGYMVMIGVFGLFAFVLLFWWRNRARG